MGSKKGYWTLTRLVRVTYTAREDCCSDNYEEPTTLKVARCNADRALDDANSDVSLYGIELEPVPESKWEEEDFEEDEDED